MSLFLEKLDSKLPRSKLRGIHNGTIVMGAAAPKPLLAHSSRQQADGYSGNTNKFLVISPFF